MGGLNLHRPYGNDDWKRHAEQAFEALLTNTLDSVDPVTVGYGIGRIAAPTFSATVAALDNTHFDEAAAKVKIAQAVDVAGDRGKVINIGGLNAAGAFLYEALALDATATTTAVESANTYKKILYAFPASALGAQNVSLYETSSASNVVGTLAGSSAAGIGAYLAIPAATGTFVAGGSYVTDKGRFMHGGITAVYNLTDDPNRATNLLAVGATLSGGVARPFGSLTNGHIWSCDKVLLTAGVGSAKTYEVHGTYLPYQGCVAAGDEYVVDWVDDAVYVSTNGLGTGILPTKAVYPEYYGASAQLPLTAAYADASLVGTAIDVAGITDAANQGAFVRLPHSGAMATSPRLIPEATLTVASAAAARGRQGVTIGGTAVAVAGPALAGSIAHATYLLAVGRRVGGTNANVRINEPVLMVFSSAGSSTATEVGNAFDVFKFEG